MILVNWVIFRNLVILAFLVILGSLVKNLANL